MTDHRDNFTATEMDSPNYRWKHKKIKLFIFSTTYYTPGKKNGKTSKKDAFDNDGKKYDVDVLRLKQNFKDSCLPQDFDVDTDIKPDISKEDLLKELDGMKEDRSLHNYDCYFFVFFTYLAMEDETENLRFGGENVSLHDIWGKVRDVPHFNGKPKVFLIQADDLNYPYPPQREKEKAIHDKFVERRIPIDADRLVILSKIPQMFEIIKEENIPLKDQAEEGSFLLQAFLKVMKRNKDKTPENKKLDLLSLTTEINYEVKEVIKFIKFKNKDSLPYPLVSSTFTKFLYFHE